MKRSGQPVVQRDVPTKAHCSGNGLLRKAFFSLKLLDASNKNKKTEAAKKSFLASRDSLQKEAEQKMGKFTQCVFRCVL